ncbi:uncharacterized protein EURHEDRAFT_405549 [Aspergillus ruber CBS 135680]|uniref:Uncharacterized protein n=1 Tax=Aspergillus ruber (strain CBS 135680) TaxID=1388766 RepID=A0A017S4B3_ASPRC|nr:uncharacterized protein EURHEDRAFT_405549 [Aspergillus ruber CBS 135680]EYE91873.1 hypothetical protein EURHEDRAFT_405549 [Aspergillus ruber CBS 135680]
MWVKRPNAHHLVSNVPTLLAHSLAVLHCYWRHPYSWIARIQKLSQLGKNVQLDFMQSETGKMASDLDISGLRAKYNVNMTDESDASTGELEFMVNMAISFWKQQKIHYTELNVFVDRLQERAKFLVQDKKAWAEFSRVRESK